MTTSRNDFEAPDDSSRSIDSATAASGAGGGTNRSGASTAQTSTDRPGLLARAASNYQDRKSVV